MLQHPITGSYRAEDCQFLLTPLQLVATEVEEKEQLIQSGTKHYSEMLSPEYAPSAHYLTLFRTLTARYRQRLAGEVLALARYLHLQQPDLPLTVVSLARAGTPIGALLGRALREVFQHPVQHYSISIIRDRGIDQAALRYLLQEAQRPAAGIVFLDAWTAKGVITAEFKQAIAAWNRSASPAEQLSDQLYVISDIGGSADIAATCDDYAIPSGILNATVSGLVSRTVLNEQIAPRQFHGCCVYEHLQEHDLTNWFLQQVSSQFSAVEIPRLPTESRQQRAVRTQHWIRTWQAQYGIHNVNHIKPGVAEATRVMLRRVPQRLLLREVDSPDVEHLRCLAAEKDIPIDYVAQMPFQAAAFIRVYTP